MTRFSRNLATSHEKGHALTADRAGRRSFPPKKTSGKARLGQSQGGQIIVEYVLLLAIAVGIALLMTRTLIGRDQGNEGFVIQAWQTLIEQIGKDASDDAAAPKK